MEDGSKGELLRRARVILDSMYGNGADFRDGQFEAIDRLVRTRSRLLIVQKTGWGKSVVYFIAAKWSIRQF